MASTTKTKIYLLAIVFPLFLLTTWSCERSFPPGSEMDEQPRTQMQAEPECYVGTLAEFGLDVHHSSHYRIEIPSPPSFHLIEDCMCNMQYIELEFDYLPEATDILVTDGFGINVPFSGPSPGVQGPYIRVYADDLTPVIVVDFDQPTLEDPQLISEGGFCLIDNISGPYPPGDNIYNEPYLRVNPNSFKNETWIPSIMTYVP